MPRLPTYHERAELARVRAERRRELLDQADQMRGEIAQLARDCVALTFGPGEEPGRERVDAQLARLEAARAAAQLLRLLIEVDDPAQLGDLPDQLQAAMGRWKRASEGWWEARIVERPKLLITKDKATGQVRIDVVMWPFGPYYYRHWRQEGRQHTLYLGKKRPPNLPERQEVPAIPEPRPLALVSRLGREALALAEQLAVRSNVEQDAARQRRLRRLLRAAGRRVERRLRAERQEDEAELGVSDGDIHTTILDISALARPLDDQARDVLQDER